MRNLISRYWLMTVGLLAVVAGGYAWAQGIIPLASPVGTELLTVYPLAPGGGLGGGQAQININQIRNATGYQLSSLTSGALTLPTSTNRLILTAVVSGALAVTTPASPFDGEMVEIVNGSGSAFTATVTLTANSGQTVNSGAVATLAANASAEWQYVSSTTTWYRLR
jgi:hypothetical protein